ncbi:Oligopeptide transport ATP-binding protein OppD [Phycisphaerae bacterium RAS1]|nr:Oligopeptide transport ATP-binding protein OppD [Phycisphaerae bacterium RAS1]
MLLEIQDLCIAFGGDIVVDKLSLALQPGRTLALVGESGCGKSVTALALLGLLRPPGRVIAGHIRFNGIDLLAGGAAAWRGIRGQQIAMIFQEPMTSLNPVLSVGSQVAEPLRVHRGFSRRAAAARAAELLEQVGIPSPPLRMRQFPHELSGGMRQRVMIAMALACEPKLLIADEPTTALDVTVQAEILTLLRELQARLGMAMIFITHDMGVVDQIADDAAVMYAGRVVETGPAADVLRDPWHPYTRALLRCAPVLAGAGGARRLETIAGEPPRRGARPAGCAFHPRCAHAEARCGAEEQALVARSVARACACWKAPPSEAAAD